MCTAVGDLSMPDLQDQECGDGTCAAKNEAKQRAHYCSYGLHCPRTSVVVLSAEMLRNARA